MERKNRGRFENEEEVVMRAISDVQYFTVIYDHYYSRIYNYIRLRVANSDTAEDLASLVFEKMLAKRGYYSPQKGKFSAWLYTIAANTVKNHLKAQKRHVFNFTAEIEKIAVAIEPDIDEKVMRQETKGQLLNALKQLSVREQKIIALKFWGDLTNRQIARMLELNENNVAVIIFRALKRLKGILADNKIEIDSINSHRL